VLAEGLDAFAARIGAIDRAERAVDLQVYIFHDDVTGRLVLERLLAAADRGVRVHTVSVGTQAGSFINFKSGPEFVGIDADALKEIAGRTRGQFFRAERPAALEDTYRGLGTRVAFESRDRELTVVLAAVAALLLVLSAYCALAWFNRLEGWRERANDPAPAPARPPRRT